MDCTSEFPLDDDLIYLNHAAVGPWPHRTVQAIESFARENMHSSIRHYHLWVEVENRLRERLARLIGARDPDTIALLKNTSEGISTVAFGLPWEADESVVLPANEFPANRAPWQALADRGVEVRLVDTGTVDPESALLDQCDASTRVLAVSSVGFADGMKLDLERLGQACRQRGMLFCVDAIQSLGVAPMDVEALHIDVLAGGSHKWLLSPEGVGFFYCRDELIGQIQPLSRGWRMGPEPFAFEKDSWGPAPNARRFECGTLNTLGLMALDASLSLFEELGYGEVEGRVMERTDALVDALSGLPGWRLATPRDRRRRAGIVSLAGEDTAGAFRALRRAGVLPALRDGLLRLSPHFHTPMKDIEHVCELLTEHCHA